MSATISVIVPNYNHARFLPKRIDSILNQTYQDFELVLLDDCSTDDSRSVLARYAVDSRVRIELNKKNSGSTFKQWNKGVRLGQGKYVWIAESDDYADSRFLERLIGILDADEALAYAYCRSWRITSDDTALGFEDTFLQYQGPRGWSADYTVDGRQECRDYFLFINPVPNASAAVFRRSACEAVGGADENFVLCGDWKFWAAIALTGRVAYVAEPLNYYRAHEATQRSRTGRKSVSVAESLQVVRWILDRVDLSQEQLLRVYKAHAAGWVPELMSSHISIESKRKIFGHAKALDPHPLRRVAAPALETFRRSFGRRWRSFRSVAPAKSTPVTPL